MNIEVIEEKFSKLSPSQEKNITTKQFRGTKTDSYIRQNSGVCFILDQDPTYEVFNPSFAIMESRNTYRPILEHGQQDKELSYKLLTRHVQFHEIIHANQIGSPLIWREMANHAGAFYLDLAIKELKNDRLDYEQPGEKIKGAFSQIKKTTREMLTDSLDLIVMQSLSQHEVAKDMRKHGTYVARMNAGIPIMNKYGNFDMKTLKETIPLDTIENSATKQNYLKIKKAMQSSDLECMRQTHKEAEEFSNEMLGIIETMAEAFALEVDKDFIMSMENKNLSIEKRKKMHSLLYEEVSGRGIRAKQYMEAMKFETQKERNEKMASSGLKYQQIIEGEQHESPVKIKLMRLGYHPLNPLGAYENMEELAKRAAKQNIPLEKLLSPINAANSLLGLRYNVHLSEFTNHIQKHGRHQAFENMLNAETFSDIIDK